MKRLYLFLLTALLLLPLFCSCVMTGEDETLTARIVRIYPDADAILLAPMGMSEGQPPMFLSWEWHEDLTEGDCLVLTYRGGMVEEQSPYLNAPVFRPKKTVSVTTDGKRFDNIASIYLNVLTDLAKEEEQYFDGKTQLAIDIEETALPANEQHAIAAAFAQMYPSMTVIEESRSDLKAKGFLTQLYDGPRWYWSGGVILKIYENTNKCTDRTRYFGTSFNCGFTHGWSDCSTSRDADSGVWSAHKVGGLYMAD